MANPEVFTQADFTSAPSGIPHAEQLREELEAADLSSTPVTFLGLTGSRSASAAAVAVRLSGDPDATDIATIGAVVAAHTGTGAAGNPEIKIITGTTYTLQDEDHLLRLYCTHVDGCAITVPPGLDANYRVYFESRSATGQVTFIEGVGATVDNVDDHMALLDKFSASGSLMCSGVASTLTLQGTTGVTV